MAEVCISTAQRNAHVAAELVAVVAVAPFMFWLALASRSRLSPEARAAAGAIGVATLLVDGALLVSYLSRHDSV